MVIKCESGVYGSYASDRKFCSCCCCCCCFMWSVVNIMLIESHAIPWVNWFCIQWMVRWFIDKMSLRMCVCVRLHCARIIIAYCKQPNQLITIIKTYFTRLHLINIYLHTQHTRTHIYVIFPLLYGFVFKRRYIGIVARRCVHCLYFMDMETIMIIFCCS